MSVDKRLRGELTALAETYQPDADAALARITSAPAPRAQRRPRWIATAAIAAVAVLVAGIGVATWWHRPRVAQPAGEWGAVGAWTQLPAAPLSARREPVTVEVAGRFLVIGGWDGPPCPEMGDCAPSDAPALRDGAAFDPATGTWHGIAEAPVPIDRGSVAVVGGKLYIATYSYAPLATPARFVRYDPATDRWDVLPKAPDGAALVAAGTSVVAIADSDEQARAVDKIFDQETDTWGTLPDDPLGPSFSRDAVWLGDRLLLTAHDLVPNPGSTAPSVVRMATLDLTTLTWTVLPDSDILGDSPVVCGRRVVFPMLGTADGGQVGNWGRDVPFGGIFDPATSTWQALPEPPRGGASRLGVPVIVDQQVLVGGHLLDPATLSWTRLTAMPGPKRSAEGVAGGSGVIFVWGGAEANRSPKNLDTGYLYRVS